MTNKEENIRFLQAWCLQHGYLTEEYVPEGYVKEEVRKIEERLGFFSKSTAERVFDLFTEKTGIENQAEIAAYLEVNQKELANLFDKILEEIKAEDEISKDQASLELIPVQEVKKENALDSSVSVQLPADINKRVTPEISEVPVAKQLTTYEKEKEYAKRDILKNAFMKNISDYYKPFFSTVNRTRKAQARQLKHSIKAIQVNEIDFYKEIWQVIVSSQADISSLDKNRCHKKGHSRLFDRTLALQEQLIKQWSLDIQSQASLHEAYGTIKTTVAASKKFLAERLPTVKNQGNKGLAMFQPKLDYLEDYIKTNEAIACREQNFSIAMGA